MATTGTEQQLEPMPGDWQRALAVVAHPDDMEYGAAAAVVEWIAEGKEVGYLLATRGEAGIDDLEPGESARVREQEQRASTRTVGVTTLEFLDHRDGVIEEGVPLRRDIAAALRRHRPELVVTLNHHDTWGGRGWNTPDHRALGRSVLDAVGDAGNRWIFPDQLEGGELEPWDGVRWVAVAGSPEPTHAVPVGEEAVRTAAASLAEHRAYISALSDEPVEDYARSFAEWSVRLAADRFGGRECVAFELYPR
ncbi:N-acetylglucosaminyl deacetylase, LmbE family [Streptomyces sp. WMMB 714]|jgi:LmbE family N-acetylglucosaminyl deacetylase|uniref:PIG-L deacetylase family protein n=1 Tax=Streptomyces sp. WMMB 714 TaxID=1286822 RepID=UPI0005F79A03|nr:PIG-L deacetylase family protein [Streptomyces sp. WMMB 714]SCK29685.1 N-acetylglucosaminyl deacetylase, LmbE family [Streptomyces sp. WMMB 714]